MSVGVGVCTCFCTCVMPTAQCRLKQLLQQANLNGIIETATTIKEGKAKLLEKLVECAKQIGVPEYKNKPTGNKGKDYRDLKTLFKKRISLIGKMRSKLQYRTENTTLSSNSKIIKF